MKNSAPELTPHAKVCTAISIIQNYILAEDSNLHADKLFDDNRFMPMPALEWSTRLLHDVLPELDQISLEQHQELFK